MALSVENNHAAGVPQTILAGGLQPTGLAWHWTAGGVGRAGALATIRYFILAAAQVNASYHILLWWDALALVTGVMWIVPAERASHSINPGKIYQHSAAALSSATLRQRELARFAEVKRILGRDAYDPNAGCISISFCGMPADLAEALKSPIFRADVKELAGRLIRGFPTITGRPHFGHGWIQPITRYETDARTGAADMLIGPVLYGATAPAPAPAPQEEDDMLPTRRKAEVWRALTDVPAHQGPSEAEPVIETIAAGATFPSIQEQAEVRNGAWATIGPWRTVVLDDDRTAYVRRTAESMEPVPAPGFDALNRGTLYEVDTAAVPAWPLEAPATSTGPTEAEIASRIHDATQSVAAAAKAQADKF